MAKKRWTKWTDETVAKFIEMYPNSSWDVLLHTFPFSKSTMNSKASELGISRRNRYSEAEDSRLSACYHAGLDDEEIAAMLPGRTASGISCRRLKLGLVSRRHWSKEEDELLRRVYGAAPSYEIEEFFPGRSRNAIISHANSIGIDGYFEYGAYTQEECDFIVNNYLQMTDKEIASYLGRTWRSVKSKRSQLGYYRTNDTTCYEDVCVYVRRHNAEWKLASMINCGYRCALSGDRFDEIHHLVSQNTIIRNVFDHLGYDMKTFDINEADDESRSAFLTAFYAEQAKYPLGVCLTHEIHMHFHNEYGYGDNTPDQFYQFVERFYPDRLKNIA